MKKVLLILNAILLTGISIAQNTNDIEYAIVEFLNPSSLNRTSYRDTLLVGCETSECFLIWNNDTVAKAWRYGGPVGYVAPLCAFCPDDVFIIEEYHGDGCPQVFRLLHIKDSVNYFLSESFGNCGGPMKIKIGSYYQTIELHFPSYIEESENDYYKSKIFIYNRRTFELTEKPYN